MFNLKLRLASVLYGPLLATGVQQVQVTLQTEDGRAVTFFTTNQDPITKLDGDYDLSLTPVVVTEELPADEPVPEITPDAPPAELSPDIPSETPAEVPAEPAPVVDTPAPDAQAQAEQAPPAE